MYRQHRRYFDDASSYASSAMTDEDEECVSFLMTLKYRSVTPDLLDDRNRCVFKPQPHAIVMHQKNEGAERTELNGAVGFSTDRTVVVNTDPFLHSRQGKNDIPTPTVYMYDSIDAYSNSKSNHEAPPVCMPLGLPEDEYWLSDLQCYIRSQCTEFFTATEADVTSSASASNKIAKRERSTVSCGGRRGPITLGRVGIRCVFCRDAVPSTRASQATSFPSQISGIYGAVVMMQCRHFPNCHMMPTEVREKLATLKRGGGNAFLISNGEKGSSSNGGTPGRQQYWAESARKLGLIDTLDGIRLDYAAEPTTVSSSTSFFQQEQPDKATSSYTPVEINGVYRSPPSVVSAPQEGQENAESTECDDEKSDQQNLIDLEDITSNSALTSLMGDSLLVSIEDRDLVPDHLFVAMAQMKPCQLTEADRVGCYKERELGFTGMCCKHCGGQPGFGKYFPATVRSLAQTTTSQTIIKHVGAKCRLCPDKIRNAIVALQQETHGEKTQAGSGSNSSNNGRLRYGSRKIFFQRVWGRLHGETVPGVPMTNKEDENLGASPVDRINCRRQSSSHKRSRYHHDDTSIDVTESSSITSSSSDDESEEEEPVEIHLGNTLFPDSNYVDDDSSCSSADSLVDNKNRRVIVRRPVLPTKKAHQKRKRNSIHSRAASNNKRFKPSLQ